MDTKEKILSTSFKLFVNNGYHNTSMQQLVETSKMSKGAFYHYFKGKNDLYRQVINQYFFVFLQRSRLGKVQTSQTFYTRNRTRNTEFLFEIYP